VYHYLRVDIFHTPLIQSCLYIPHITCNKYAIEHKIKRQQIVLEHFSNGKGARDNPKYPVSPQWLIHISLILASEHNCSECPSDEPEDIDHTIFAMLACVEQVLAAHQTASEHEQVQETIEQTELWFYHIAGGWRFIFGPRDKLWLVLETSDKELPGQTIYIDLWRLSHDLVIPNGKGHNCIIAG
jgi:hypothetical protein